MEKVPTTAVRAPLYKGVLLSSRYSKAFELEKMADMIDAIDPELVQKIDSIFCDSKATHCFEIKLKSCEQMDVWTIGYQIELGSMPGHNGIHISEPSGLTLDLDPFWADDVPEDTDEPE